MSMSMKRGPLSPYEMACLTAQVPASGDARIDGIIVQGLRFKVAAQILEALVARKGMDASPIAAVVMADELIKCFSTPTNRRAGGESNAKETKT